MIAVSVGFHSADCARVLVEVVADHRPLLMHRRTEIGERQVTRTRLIGMSPDPLLMVAEFPLSRQNVPIGFLLEVRRVMPLFEGESSCLGCMLRNWLNTREY